MKRPSVALVSTSCLLASAMCEAANSPPPPLLGNSVILHWTESRHQIVVDTQSREQVNRRQALIVYLGSTARVFSRMTYNGARSASSDQTEQTCPVS